MDNQHKHIKGYRDLSQEEIDMMNRIRAKGEELRDLVNELGSKAEIEVRMLESAALISSRRNEAEDASQQAKDALRWVHIGRDHLQQGIMALVRSVARPESF